MTCKLKEFIETERNGYRDANSMSLIEWLRRNPNEIDKIAEEVASKYEEVLLRKTWLLNLFIELLQFDNYSSLVLLKLILPVNVRLFLTVS